MTACHAEGRGFESLHPLRKSPGNLRAFLFAGLRKSAMMRDCLPGLSTNRGFHRDPHVGGLSTPGGQPTGVQSASFVSPAGKVAHPQQFTVTPLAPTIRPAGATGTYPLAWHLVVTSAHVDVTLTARARNQFIANQFIPGFWEGAAAITSGAPGSCIVESTREPL